MKQANRTSLLSGLRRRDLRTLLHPQKALHRILAAAVRSTRADAGSFILINPNTGLLDIEASLGLSEKAKKVKLRPGEGITGWVATTGQPLRTGDVHAERRYVSINPKVRSEMAVPVEMRGQVVGLLNVDSVKIDAFSATDEARLVDMASEAAQWLELAWEIDQLRMKGRQLTSLVNIAQMILSETNLGEILEQITVQTSRLMKARLCAVFLLNDGGSELVLRACQGGTKLYRQKPNLSMEDSLLGTVVKRRKPLAVVDVVEEKGYVQTDIARRERLVSMLAVPLIFTEKTLGALVVYTQQRHRFSNDEIKLLTTLGDLSAVAIEKGRLLARVVDMEEKLRASERLSALGLLAAEIAHEIRNPLTVMQMLFHALAESLQLDATSQKDAQLISEKMRQMNRILDQVLSFARSSEPIKESVHADQLIDDVFLLTRHKLLAQGIEVRSSVPEGLPPFRADRAQIEQVLLNLILNASEAMPKGGTLRLSAALENLEEKPHLALSIRDTGQGMSQDQINHLFAPFLTYKQSGTGIGLAIVKKIMENHQSKVEIESRLGQGTRFKLLFPVSESELPEGT
ncbi:MAG TPA: GAF domain-containing protein [Candidatus Methylacidiphilales bacterium]|nr:GAF domain-containing protein [Candidatus Methylacidiphilales bacterium]